MEQKRTKITLFLLTLYMIVPLHGAVAHEYDGELLQNLLCPEEEYHCDNRSEVSFCKSTKHFNILPDAIYYNIQKNHPLSANKAADKFTLNSCFGKRLTIFTDYHSQHRLKYNHKIFSLRSPPLV